MHASDVIFNLLINVNINLNLMLTLVYITLLSGKAVRVIICVHVQSEV